VDCGLLLEAWNLFDDIAASIGAHLHDRGERRDKVYDKLFWGNNLPAVTPPGRSYQPLWNGCELRILRSVLRRGLDILPRHVRQM
jgi:hypothetical protein